MISRVTKSEILRNGGNLWHKFVSLLLFWLLFLLLLVGFMCSNVFWKRHICFCFCFVFFYHVMHPSALARIQLFKSKSVWANQMVNWKWYNKKWSKADISVIRTNFSLSHPLSIHPHIACITDFKRCRNREKNTNTHNKCSKINGFQRTEEYNVT